MAERRRHCQPTSGQAWLQRWVPQAKRGGQSAQVLYSLESCALLQSVKVLLAGRLCSPALMLLGMLLRCLPAHPPPSLDSVCRTVHGPSLLSCG